MAASYFGWIYAGTDGKSDFVFLSGICGFHFDHVFLQRLPGKSGKFSDADIHGSTAGRIGGYLSGGIVSRFCCPDTYLVPFTYTVNAFRSVICAGESIAVPAAVMIA